MTNVTEMPTPGSRPSRMNPWLSSQLARARNALMEEADKTFAVHAVDSIGPNVRKELVKRLEKLDDALLPADERRVMIAVTHFFQTYPQMRLMAEEDAHDHIVRY